MGCRRASKHLGSWRTPKGRTCFGASIVGFPMVSVHGCLLRLALGSSLGAIGLSAMLSPLSLAQPTNSIAFGKAPRRGETEDHF